MNESRSTDPIVAPEDALPLGLSVDADAEGLIHPGVPAVDRILAALAYIGFFSILVSATKPRSTFVKRHALIALKLFALRMLWAGLILALWWGFYDQGGTLGRMFSAAVDLSILAVIMVPRYETLQNGALPWLLWPVVISAVLSIGGGVLAVLGRSADFEGFTRADWSDPLSKRTFLRISPEEEREIARRARARQIERLQKSSRMMRTEQDRRDQISMIEIQLERIVLQREYHDQLLSLGEISQRRYEQVNVELDEQAEELRGRLSSLETRASNINTAVAGRSPVNRLRRPSETMVESIAIVTPDGVPIFTYGQFQLDDAIVAGMLSAFDSLSEEVFGSRVHKTALAEGQVLYFAHGDYVLIMASFTDEPSPRQVEDLRTMLKQFEAANQSPIARGQYNPAHLHEVPVPFRFAERMPRDPDSLRDSA